MGVGIKDLRSLDTGIPMGLVLRPWHQFSRGLMILLLSFFGADAALAQATDFVAFESGSVRPMALSPDGSRLVVCNTPDGQLEIFDVLPSGLQYAGSVPVGLEPVAVAARNNDEFWVVNHLSDSVSIVDLSSSPGRVVRTLLVGDEPRDIVFGGAGGQRAFISTAHRGQHRTNPTLAGVNGAGDPQLSTPGVGRADVWVFDAANPGHPLGGSPIRILSFFSDTPRALAISPDGNRVYVAAFTSGNQTTAILETSVPDGFDSAPANPGSGAPGGVPGPDDNADGDSAPESGVIVKYDGSAWLDAANQDWSAVVRLSLPDLDVFSFDANVSATGNPSVTSFASVGTILFNMAVNPVTEKLYVTNTELPNHIRFEGPGDHGGTTVQGQLSKSRITVIDPTTSSVDPQHLNQHIDYSRLHTDVPDLVDETQIDHSLATPLEIVVSGDGTKIYVAAFGSAKIGVFDASAIEDSSFESNFDPTVASADYIETEGGPAGIVLDETHDRLYVLARFTNSVSSISTSSRSTLQTIPLHNPEPDSLIEGRPFLYDARATSGNGEASCSSCHIFGDVDHLAWNLGDPDEHVTTNTQPEAVPILPGQPTFHPMKGPMTTQTLRGIGTHGAHHWRGDRVDGFFGLDPCNEPTGAPCNEDLSFRNFIVAFEGLVGMEGTISNADMQKFTDFTLQLQLPPNPIRNLDNSLTAQQAVGRSLFLASEGAPLSDTVTTCDGCHTLDPSRGFFGTGGERTFEGEPQDTKVAHMRNLYTKIGMFGDSDQSASLGQQVRGFGFLHDGAIGSVSRFLQASVFQLSTSQEADLEAFSLAFPTDLAPIVGQQVTLTSVGGIEVNARIDLLKARASTNYNSLTLGGNVPECDLVVKANVSGVARGAVYEPGSGLFRDDQGNGVTDAVVRSLASSSGPVTFTCVPPGLGTRMGIDRDRDLELDGLDNCPSVSNPNQVNTDGDAQGNLCDADDDNDGLLDAAETNTGIFVDSLNTGTNPLFADSDGDGINDGEEVSNGWDPTDPSSPNVVEVPLLSWPSVATLLLLFVGVGYRSLVVGRRRSA